MFFLKTILSSLLWALLVLFVPIFSLEIVSQSSLGIGTSKFFLKAVIYLTIFFWLIAPPPSDFLIPRSGF